jgi:hypothetical protein
VSNRIDICGYFSSVISLKDIFSGIYSLHSDHYRPMAHQQARHGENQTVSIFNPIRAAIEGWR